MGLSGEGCVRENEFKLFCKVLTLKGGRTGDMSFLILNFGAKCDANPRVWSLRGRDSM